MNHRITKRLSSNASQEIVEVELLAANEQQAKLIRSISQPVEDYLTLKLGALEIIENRAPVFVIRRVKDNPGFGS
jgi:hypothetical protein